MKMRKPSTRAVTTGIAASALFGLAFAAPAANAAPAEKASPKKAASVAKQLGPAHTAGTYIDSSGKSVVNVTDQASADAVRKAGDTPRLVDYSTKQLSSVKKSLDSSGLVAGTAWSIDPKSNRVTITTDKTVTGAKMAKVKEAAKQFGDKVVLRKSQGTYATKITGGDAIWGDGGRCSLGFNVVYNSDPDKHAFLTAGHCGNAIQTW